MSELESLKPVDIEEYMEYLKYYTYNGKQYSNDERGIHRKIASLKSFYLYYQKRELISNNPTTVIDMPKLHDKEIIRLDSDEVAELLELVENAGEHLTGKKKVYYEKNKLRNIAIFTLFLGTGIRVSECVGLNIEDVDFKENRIKIIRKGGKEEYVYFGEDVAEALGNYIELSRLSLIHILVLILFAIYILVLFVQSLQSDNISIYEVTQNKLANDDTVKGIILRDEKLVRANTSGYINYYVAEGAYVGVNTTVYSTDSSGFFNEELDNVGADSYSLSESDTKIIRSAISEYRAGFKLSD